MWRELKKNVKKRFYSYMIITHASYICSIDLSSPKWVENISTRNTCIVHGKQAQCGSACHTTAQVF